MYTKTRFQELTQLIGKASFDRIVQQNKGNKGTKSFRAWDHLLALMYGQITGARSLREIEQGFNHHVQSHYHLGTREVKRSTLADANNRRKTAVFEALLAQLLTTCNRKVRRSVEPAVQLLDSTPIVCKGQGFDQWAKAHKSSRHQGLKAHIVYAHHDQLPTYVHLTKANVNDVTDAEQMPIESGVTYVFDKGYCSYNWWHKIDQSKACFVTRQKSNAAIGVLETSPAAEHTTGSRILSDEKVRFTNKNPGAKRKNLYTQPLRRVTVERLDKDTPLILLTNDFERSACEIAELYKDRWNVELFFKWIKQNLKIKTFFGRSERAVRIQLLVALIVYVLVALYRKKTGLSSRLKDVLVLLKHNLFEHPQLEERKRERADNRRRRREFEARQQELSYV